MFYSNLKQKTKKTCGRSQRFSAWLSVFSVVCILTVLPASANTIHWKRGAEGNFFTGNFWNDELAGCDCAVSTPEEAQTRCNKPYDHWKGQFVFVPCGGTLDISGGDADIWSLYAEDAVLNFGDCRFITDGGTFKNSRTTIQSGEHDIFESTLTGGHLEMSGGGLRFNELTLDGASFLQTGGILSSFSETHGEHYLYLKNQGSYRLETESCPENLWVNKGTFEIAGDHSDLPIHSLGFSNGGFGPDDRNVFNAPSGTVIRNLTTLKIYPQITGNGLKNTVFVFDKEDGFIDGRIYPGASLDKGCDESAFIDNYALKELRIGAPEHPVRVMVLDQNSTTLYVETLYIGPGSILDMNDTSTRLRYKNIEIAECGELRHQYFQVCSPEDEDLLLEPGPRNPVDRQVKVNAEHKAVVHHFRLINNADTAATLSRLTYNIYNGPFFGTEARLFRDAACDGTPDADDLIGVASPLDTTTIGFPMTETLASGQQTCYLLEFGWQRLTDVPFSLTMGASIGPEQVAATLNGSAADCGGAPRPGQSSRRIS